MDTNSKNLAYNTSSYAQREAAKQAIFSQTKFGQAASALSATSSGSTSASGITYYTMPDGKVLARQSSSKYIDFKTLFSFLDEDDGYGTYTGIGNYGTTASNYMAAYEKIAKQRLGLS